VRGEARVELGLLLQGRQLPVLLEGCEAGHLAVHRCWETACLLQGLYLLGAHAGHDRGSDGAIRNAIRCHARLCDGLCDLPLDRGCLGDADVSDLRGGERLLWVLLAGGLLSLQYSGSLLLLEHLTRRLLLFAELCLTVGFQFAKLGWGLHLALAVLRGLALRFAQRSCFGR
jgi:hypothetical protein